MKNKRLKVLFLAALYPSEENPISGIFVKEHARAVSLFTRIKLQTPVFFKSDTAKQTRHKSITQSILFSIIYLFLVSLKESDRGQSQK
jgi:hypothetical protein